MYATRLKAVLVVLGLGLALVLGSLFYLQILEGGRYGEEARQRLRRAPGFHPTIRGAIYDRSGILLAQDTGAFDVAIYYPFVEMTDAFRDRLAHDWGVAPEEAAARVERMGSELARLTGVPRDELARRADTIRARVEVIRQSVRELHGRSIRVREETYGERTSVPHPLVYGVDLATVGAISSRPDDFPGLVVLPTRQREYFQGAVAPHVIGRLGEVTREELQGRLNDLYRPGDLRRYWPGDLIGRGGVEGACEDILRGSRGLFQKGIEGNFLEDIPPVPGRDVHLTLDIALQADVEALLDHPPDSNGGHRVVGAAVVIDCRTGEVLALATSPRYDPRTFQADFADLATDSAAPLVNRAVSGLYPLGSVFKAVTATAALEEGAITPQTVFTCEGVLDPAYPRRFRCDIFVSHGAAHGTIPLRTAIQKSCNVYFYNVAEQLGRTVSGRIDLAAASARLQTWAGRMGLGRPTGLGLVGEPAGRLDERDPRNLAVGQGLLLVTPLQVAQLYGLVATDGRMPPLRLIQELGPSAPPRHLALNPRHMAVLRDAFTAVVNEPGGTAYSTAYLPELRFAGKTGTAQSGGGEPHAWFAGFAPADAPRIAFAVIVEHGGHGGTIAGPIAREIVRACLSHGYLGDRPRASDVGKSPAAAPNRPAPVGNTAPARTPLG